MSESNYTGHDDQYDVSPQQSPRLVPLPESNLSSPACSQVSASPGSAASTQASSRAGPPSVRRVSTQAPSREESPPVVRISSQASSRASSYASTARPSAPSHSRTASPPPERTPPEPTPTPTMAPSSSTSSSCTGLTNMCDACRIESSKISRSVSTRDLECKGDTYPVIMELKYTGSKRDLNSRAHHICDVVNNIYNRRSGVPVHVSLPSTGGSQRRYHCHGSVSEVTVLIDFPEAIAPGGEIGKLIRRGFGDGVEVREVKHPQGDKCLHRLKWFASVYPPEEEADFDDCCHGPACCAPRRPSGSSGSSGRRGSIEVRGNAWVRPKKGPKLSPLRYLI
ncbi:hypothetical protein BDV18DRAFT_161849 [Aspergillus unguis]